MKLIRTMRLAVSAGVLGLAATGTAMAGSDTQYWQTVQGTVNVAPDTVVSNELVLRSSDAKGFYELENNLMLGYKLNKVVTVYAGWTANPLYNHGTYNTMENRFRQQVAFDKFMSIGPAKISARIRLEERWRDGFSGTAWRLRPYAKISMPIAGKTALNLTHESFIDLNTNGFQKVAGYERMRNAILINTPLSKHFTLEGGYLEQHGFVPGGPDSDDHVMTIQLNATF